MKKITFCLCFILLSVGIQAQIGFELNETFPNDNLSRFGNVNIADFDNDGDNDLKAGPIFGWLENRDDSFVFSLPREIINRSSTSWFVKVGDVNNDGFVDIVRSNYIWINNGDGTFRSPYRVVVSTSNDESFLVDFDGDGLLDIWYGTRIFFNSGAPGIWDEQTDFIGDIEDPFIVEFFDADNDGDKDLLIIDQVSSGTDFIFYFPNEGRPNIFSTSINIGDGFGEIRYLESGDIDNDGNIDILFSTSTGIYKRMGNGDGTFEDAVAIYDDIGGGFTIYLDDFDNDDDLDMVFRQVSPRRWYYGQNADGLGNYSPRQEIITEDFDPFNNNQFIAADFNNDGLKDLVSHSFATFDVYKVNVYENTGDAVNPFGAQYPVSPLVDFDFTAAAVPFDYGDVDGDGDNDQLIFATRSGRITWLENTGSEVFEYAHKVEEGAWPNDGAGPSTAAFFDADGDGDLDVMWTEQSPGGAYWNENLDGLGTYGPANLIDDDVIEVPEMLFHDLDNDGDQDIILLKNFRPVWYENLDGAGNFSSANPISSSSSSTMSLYDIDRDGILDLLIGSIWYRGTNSNPPFAGGDTLPGTVSQQSRPLDFDLDGDTDFVRISDDRSQVELIENTGSTSGGFIVTTIADASDEIVELEVGNFSPDGYIDVAYLDTAGEIVVMENLDGIGEFSSVIYTYDDPTIYDLITSVDVDTDGVADLAYSTARNGRQGWYRNLATLGEGVITGAVSYTSATDCTIDDPTASNIGIKLSNGTSELMSFTNSAGVYNLDVPLGAWEVSIGSELPDVFTSAPESYFLVLDEIDETQVADFCLTSVSPGIDASISLFTLDEFRPGRSGTVKMVISNLGTEDISGIVSLNFNDDLLNFDEASVIPATSGFGVLSFNYSDLDPFSIVEIDISFDVEIPPIADDGDPLDFTSEVTPVDTDINPDDNVYETTVTIVNSFDPNDIRVMEGEEVLIEDANNYLNYIIRFQNIGSASAIDIRVENPLDFLLDTSTLQIQGLSHEAEIEIIDNELIQFTFTDINLPSADTDEEGSQGYIAYRIKPIEGVTVGDDVSNFADIFFDFNPPIRTNTEVTTFIDPLSVRDFERAYASLYPNPTDDVINIQSVEKVTEVVVYNQLGQVVLKLEENKGVLQFGVEELSAGLYFVQLRTDGGTRALQKLIKR